MKRTFHYLPTAPLLVFLWALSLNLTALGQPPPPASQPSGGSDVVGTGATVVGNLANGAEYGAGAIKATDAAADTLATGAKAGGAKILGAVTDVISVGADTKAGYDKGGAAGGVWGFIKSGTKAVLGNLAGGAAAVAASPSGPVGSVLAGLGAKIVTEQVTGAVFNGLEWGADKVKGIVYGDETKPPPGPNPGAETSRDAAQNAAQTAAQNAAQNAARPPVGGGGGGGPPPGAGGGGCTGPCR